MPYQNDMMSLADVVGPAYAAQQAGIQNQLSDQEQGLKNAVSFEQAPAEAQKPSLQNALTQAQTTAEQGVGMQQQAKGLVDMYAAPSGAQAAVSGNQLKVSQDQLQKLGQLGQMANAIAAQMDNIPAPARPAAMQQLIQHFGIDPGALGPLMQGDPDMLRTAATNMIKGSAGYQQSMAEQNLKNQGASNVAQIGAESREDVAQTRAAAAQYVADQKRQVDQMKVTIDQQIAALTQRIGSPAEQPGDKERLSFLSQQEIQVRQMQAQNTQALVGLQRPAPTLNIGGDMGAPPSSGTPPATPGGGNSLADEMRKRGFLK